MNNRRKIILAVAAVVCIAVIAIAVYLAYDRVQTDTSYTQNIKMGEKYLASGDYDNAVIAYNAAIKINDKDEDAYIGLISVYQQMGDTDMARSTAQLGYNRTKSSRLRTLLSDLTSGEGKTTGLEYTINTSVFGTVLRASYSDYNNLYGLQQVRGKSDGSVTARVKNLNATLVFQNTTGQPRAVVNGTVSTSAVPYSIAFDNPMILFGGGSSISYSDLQKLGLTDFTKTTDDSQGDIYTFTYQGCDVQVACGTDGTVTSSSWNILYPNATASDDDESSEIPVTGTIVDAQSGDAISDVSVQMWEGEDTQSGSVISSTSTDSYGEYELSADGSGYFTLELSKDGYITDYKSVYVGTNDTRVDDQDFVMTLELTSGEARIVLQWSSYPSDLDSHLEGTASDGTDVDLAFYNRSIDGVANLDLDDTDGYGPETTTIMDLNGTYTFYVIDFTQSGSLGSSGATVTLYLPGQSAQTFSVPAGANVRWDVFRLNKGQLEVINSGS